MKTLFNKYRFAALGVSAICAYFFLTGGVLSTIIPVPNVAPIGVFGTLDVGNEIKLLWGVDDSNAPRDTKKETVCEGNPPVAVEKEVEIDPAQDPIVEFGKQAPGSTTILWETPLQVYRTTNNGDMWTNANDPVAVEHKMTFSVPGVWKVYFRAKTVRSSGQSDWKTEEKTLTITGNPPLPVPATPAAAKKYTFKSMLVVQGSTQNTFNFNNPAQQFFTVKSATKVDLVFNWTPTAAERALVPTLKTSYGINEYDRDYEVVSKSEAGFPTAWYYQIKYDATRRVAFIFADPVPGKPTEAGLHYVDAASGTHYYLTFTK